VNNDFEYSALVTWTAFMAHFDACHAVFPPFFSFVFYSKLIDTDLVELAFLEDVMCRFSRANPTGHIRRLKSFLSF